jgi:hypothetical protein
MSIKWLCNGCVNTVERPSFYKMNPCIVNQRNIWEDRGINTNGCTTFRLQI